MPHRRLSRSLLCGLVLLVTALPVAGQTRPAAAPRAKTAAPPQVKLPARPRAVLQGHDKGVEALAFAPDGKFLASAAQDGTVRLWDVATNRERARLRAGDADAIVEAVAVAPDGRTVASGGTAGGIRLWDVATSKEQKTLGGGEVTTLAFLPGGADLASGGGTSVGLWNLANGEGTWQTQRESLVRTVAPSPDGRLLAWAAYGHKTPNDLTVWDIAADKEAIRLQAVGFAPFDVAFSPDGKLLAACGDRDTGRKILPTVEQTLTVGVIKLWDAASGAVRAEYDVEKAREGNRTFSCLAFSPDGRLLALGTWENTVEIWDVAPLRRRGELKAHTDYVEAVAFSPDGKTLASAGRDRAVRLWDVPTAPAAVRPVAPRTPTTATPTPTPTPIIQPGEVRRFPGHEGRVSAVAISSKGHFVLSGGDDKDLRVWELATGKPLLRLKGHTGPITGLAFTPDDRQAITCSADRSVRVWDLAAARELRRLDGHAAPISCVAVTPDGRQALSGGAGELILWDLDAGKAALKFADVKEKLRSVAITPDGLQALTGGDEKVLRFWDMRTGRQTRRVEGHVEAITGVAVFPKAPLAATASEDDSVSLWGLDNGAERGRLDHEDVDSVTALAMGPAARILTGAGDGKLRVWDGYTGRLVHTFPGHQGAITSLALARDARAAVSGGADGTVRLWYVGEPLAPPRRPGAPAGAPR